MRMGGWTRLFVVVAAVWTLAVFGALVLMREQLLVPVKAEKSHASRTNPLSSSLEPETRSMWADTPPEQAANKSLRQYTPEEHDRQVALAKNLSDEAARREYDAIVGREKDQQTREIDSAEKSPATP